MAVRWWVVPVALFVTHTHTHARTHTRTHAHTHTRTHTYTHTHIYTRLLRVMCRCQAQLWNVHITLSIIYVSKVIKLLCPTCFLTFCVYDKPTKYKVETIYVACEPLWSLLMNVFQLSWISHHISKPALLLYAFIFSIIPFFIIRYFGISLNVFKGQLCIHLFSIQLACSGISDPRVGHSSSLRLLKFIVYIYKYYNVHHG